MTTINKNVDLNAGSNSFDGWETCAASAFNVVVYTGNWFAAYSTDEGITFNSIDPNSICSIWGESLCCDQVVIYIPKINHFAWVMQTNAGNYVLAIATPQEIEKSKGKNWFTYLIDANRFDGKKEKMDYPEIAVGDNFLYMTFNLTNSGYSIALRLSLSEIYWRKPIHLIYFPTKQNYWLRPVQNTGETGYFVTQNSASELRVFSWPEIGDHITQFDVPISTIPTEDWAVKTPDGDDWLGSTSKVDWHIYGATRTGPQLWIAWNGARKVSGKSDNTFNYPHIGLAIIDFQIKKLIQQSYIWNPEHGFAWPALATNIDGDVGLSFCWGGNKWYPQHGVAMLTGSGRSFVSTTSGRSSGAGGHYISNREAYPKVSIFSASGFNQPKVKDKSTSHPHYVLFGT
jgi:hypothetical protein